MSDLKPILFNGEMVKALLEGRKTVTRRLLKPQPEFLEGETGTPERCEDGNWCFKIHQYANTYDFDYKPPYQPGDILYVRETWAMMAQVSTVSDAGYVYRADYSDTELQELSSKHFRWFPSIHMPKKAARIFLRVKRVRVERLMDITDEEALKEGCTDWLGPPSLDFKFLWDSTISKTDLPVYGCGANPWVWVIEFEEEALK